MSKNEKLIDQRFFSEIWSLARQSKKLVIFYEKLFTIEDYVNNQIEILYTNIYPEYERDYDHGKEMESKKN